MSWSTPPGAYGAADPLFLLLIALAVEAYIGGRQLRFPWVPNPRRALAGLVHGLARRLNRAERGAAERRRRGALVAGGLALGLLGLGWLGGLVTRHYPFAWTIEIFLLVALIDQRATWRLAEAVDDALRTGSLVLAREALRPLCAEHMAPGAIDALDRDAAALAALGALGRRFADRLVAPVFWYVVLGLPGLFLQQAAYVMRITLDAPAPDTRAGPYADGARSLERAMAWVPRALAGVFLVLGAGFVPGGRPWPALRRAARKPDAMGGPLAAALAEVPPAARLGRGLAAFAVACLVNAGLIGLLAIVRLGL